MIIEKHKLVGDNVIFQQTENYSRPGTFVPKSIVVHYTAMSSVDSAVKALTKKKKKNNASAHLVIGRNEIVYQLAPFNYKTWHAGTSSYNGREGYNNFAIGIEIDNLGWLDEFTREDGSKYYSRKGLKIELERKDVFKGKHINPKCNKEYWHKYNTEEVHLLTEAMKLLLKEYPTIDEIVGHNEIAPSRKVDPGPALDLDTIRSLIL